MTVLGTIELLGIRTIGCHGHLPREHSRAQPFEVDVRLDIDLSSAVASDNPDDTIDHAVVAEAVARTVELTSYRLLERLADRIAGSCMSLPAVTSAEVTVRQLRTSTPVDVASIGITIRRHVATDGAGPGHSDRCSAPAHRPVLPDLADVLPAIAPRTGAPPGG